MLNSAIWAIAGVSKKAMQSQIMTLPRNSAVVQFLFLERK